MPPAGTPYLGRGGNEVNEAKRTISIHSDSFHILSQLSVVRSHLEDNDLLANQQARAVLDELTEEIYSGIPNAAKPQYQAQFPSA